MKSRNSARHSSHGQCMPTKHSFTIEKRIPERRTLLRQHGWWRHCCRIFPRQACVDSQAVNMMISRVCSDRRRKASHDGSLRADLDLRRRRKGNFPPYPSMKLAGPPHRAHKWCDCATNQIAPLPASSFQVRSKISGLHTLSL